MSFIGADDKPTVEPGDFEVMVGNLTGKFTLAGAQSERRIPRQTRK